MKYSHIISLGFFCGVASEIERLGYREGSYPFDWCISKDWMGMSNAIMNHFEDFLSYDKMSQSIEEPQNYKNEYNVQFFHDFTKYKSLEDQLTSVQEKYDRRIQRFFTSIKEPTLLIRYINDIDGERELEYWDKNIGDLEHFLKSYNEENKIVFLANFELRKNYNNIEVYYVDKEFGSSVAKQPLIFNKEVKELFDQVEYDQNVRERNLLFYMEKLEREKRKKRKEEKITARIREKIYNILMPIKYHDKTY